jgi:hypothetical protein
VTVTLGLDTIADMKKVRNPYVLVATIRTGGGPHRDHRKGRGGSRNEQMDLLEEWSDDIEHEMSGSQEPKHVVELP